MAERVVPLIFNGMAIGADWMSADAGIIVGLAMTFGYIFAAKYGDCTIRGFNLRYPKQTIYKDGEVYMDDGIPEKAADFFRGYLFLSYYGNTIEAGGGL